MKTKLGVNVDHIATLREARKIEEPSPVQAAELCEAAGCHGITVHLREDRRHIQDRDVYTLRKTVRTKLNLEMALSEDVIAVAKNVSPDQVTLVPEKREEVTTEGGLDVVGALQSALLRDVIQDFTQKNMDVSLFIDPDLRQIEASAQAGARYIELHTGAYAEAVLEEARRLELQRLEQAVEYAVSLGLRVYAGHGLNYDNVASVARIEHIEELNIGHSIVSRAVFTGIYAAVQEMLQRIEAASQDGQ